VGEAGWVATFVLLTLWCHGPLSPLLPAAYEPVLVGYTQFVSPAVLAGVGAITSTLIEYLNYYLYRSFLRCRSLHRALRSQPARRLTTLFSTRPFLAVWLCVVSPLPDWGTRVLAAHCGYSVRRYLAAVLLARLPRFWFLATLGFHLKLGTRAAVALVATSLLIALAGLVLRRRAQLVAKAIEPVSDRYILSGG
jgi:membrane protein YqaA with SNARE-associated domain